MRQEQSPISAGNAMAGELKIRSPFIKHEWDELMYKLTNSDDQELKDIGRSLGSAKG